MSGTALVLSGGGSHGAAQVGMAAALCEFGIRPDAVFGSSVGSLNAAALAADWSGPAIRALGGLWVAIADSPLRLEARWLAAALMGRRPSLMSACRLNDIMTEHLLTRRIEETAVPLHIVATELDSGREVLFSAGALLPALLASCAVPGVLPPVRIDGVAYVDGLVHGAPVRQAVNAGFDRIFLCLSSPPTSLSPPTTFWGVARRAATLTMTRHLTDTAVDHPGVTVIQLPSVPALKGLSRRDFRNSQAVIDSAYVATARWLTTRTEVTL